MRFAYIHLATTDMIFSVPFGCWLIRVSLHIYLYKICVILSSRICSVFALPGAWARISLRWKEHWWSCRNKAVLQHLIFPLSRHLGVRIHSTYYLCIYLFLYLNHVHCTRSTQRRPPISTCQPPLLEIAIGISVVLDFLMYYICYWFVLTSIWTCYFWIWRRMTFY